MAAAIAADVAVRRLDLELALYWEREPPGNVCAWMVWSMGLAARERALRMAVDAAQAAELDEIAREEHRERGHLRARLCGEGA